MSKLNNLKSHLFASIFLMTSFGFVLFPFRSVQAGAPVLSIDKTIYYVGENPVYQVTGAEPNSDIFWSSTLDGVSTGEVNSGYGHKTDANGNFIVEGGTWTSDHVGVWEKWAMINGKESNKVTFTVREGTPPAPNLPIVDIKANNADGSVSIPYNSSANISWTSENACCCTGKSHCLALNPQAISPHPEHIPLPAPIQLALIQTA